MQIDPDILALSAVTLFVTLFKGLWSAKQSKSASAFFVGGRSGSGVGHYLPPTISQ